MNSKIFYATETGTTTQIAQQISQLTNIPHFCISDATKNDLESCEFLILGTPTWNDGSLQDDWIDFIEKNQTLNLIGKTVALFGLGDQRGHGEHFCDGLAKLYDFALSCGANIIGSYIDDDYFFENSRAFVDGKFLGLALDDDYQSELTQKRIKKWLTTLPITTI